MSRAVVDLREVSRDLQLPMTVWQLHILESCALLQSVLNEARRKRDNVVRFEYGEGADRLVTSTGLASLESTIAQLREWVLLPCRIIDGSATNKDSTFWQAPEWMSPRVRALSTLADDLVVCRKGRLQAYFVPEENLEGSEAEDQGDVCPDLVLPSDAFVLRLGKCAALKIGANTPILSNTFIVRRMADNMLRIRPVWHPVKSVPRLLHGEVLRLFGQIERRPADVLNKVRRSLRQLYRSHQDRPMWLMQPEVSIKEGSATGRPVLGGNLEIHHGSPLSWEMFTGLLGVVPSEFLEAERQFAGFVLSVLRYLKSSVASVTRRTQGPDCALCALEVPPVTTPDNLMKPDDLFEVTEVTRQVSHGTRRINYPDTRKAAIPHPRWVPSRRLKNGEVRPGYYASVNGWDPKIHGPAKACMTIVNKA